MSFDKEKENGSLNNSFFNLPSMYNASPASSPSIGNYTMPMYMSNNNNTTTASNAFNGRYPINLQQQFHQLMDNQAAHETPVVSSGTTTPHMARQLSYAQISRQSASPHHHARAAAAVARNVPVTSVVTISDPNDPNKQFSTGHGKGAARIKKEIQHEWTSLDMGGMGLRNISKTLCTYTFLTSLYINHNNLTYLMPALSQLTNLKTLDASGNKLSVLPPELGLLHNLKELLLFDNNIVTLPLEFGNLYQLETLGLEGNPLQTELKTTLYKDGTQALIMSLREDAPVGLPPPNRDWLLIDGDTAEDPEKFTVLSYNILCRKYATSQVFGYTPSWALDWEYRKDLLVPEILGHNADVICLQEMEMAEYEDYFEDYFKKMGDYGSVFHPKTRAKTMAERERRAVDGCVIFYKTSRFTLVDSTFIEYNQKALQRPDFKQTADIYNRIMNKDNVAVVVMLQDNITKQHLMVATSHIHWDPSDSDVKLVQVGILMDELKVFATKHVGKQKDYTSVEKIPTIICGDYNSTVDSGVYEYFTKGHIPQFHPDFGHYSYGAYTKEGLSHPYSLKSSYGSIGELPFTNYTPDFKGVLDYILFTTNSLDIMSLLGPIDNEYLRKVVGFPNAHFPSDHIPLMAEFKFKAHSDKKAIKADFHSLLSNRSK